MMDEWRKQALRDNQHMLSGVLVMDILSNIKPYLTEMECLQVEKELGNVAQVDELISILLTKENHHFDGFCRALECSGYNHLAQQLQAAAGVGRSTDLTCALYPFPFIVHNHSCLVLITL